MIFNQTSQTNYYLQVILLMDRLSYKAKGIFAYLISNYTEDGISLSQLVIASYDGQSGVITGLRELINNKILYEVEISDETIFMIDFKGVDWHISKKKEYMHKREIPRKLNLIMKRNEEPESKTDSLMKINEELESKTDSYEDELLYEALEIVVKARQASVSLLQRRMRIGYTRAARMIDTLEMMGYIGPYEGSKPREVLMSSEQFQEIIKEKVMVNP